MFRFCFKQSHLFQILPTCSHRVNLLHSHHRHSTITQLQVLSLVHHHRAITTANSRVARRLMDDRPTDVHLRSLQVPLQAPAQGTVHRLSHPRQLDPVQAALIILITISIVFKETDSRCMIGQTGCVSFRSGTTWCSRSSVPALSRRLPALCPTSNANLTLHIAH